MLADPKSEKKKSSCHSFFALLGSVCEKAARRTLMILTKEGACFCGVITPIFQRISFKLNSYRDLLPVLGVSALH